MIFLPVIFINDKFGVFVPHEGTGVLDRPVGVGFKEIRVHFVKGAVFFLSEEVEGLPGFI
jgi:hypothetical protein